MTDDTLESLRYPIGRFVPPAAPGADEVNAWIDDIRTLPARLRALVEPFTDAQLDTPYRPDGWTARQVVHHVADSHVNSFVRFKWALTEDAPVIKAYFEERWALLPDTLHAPVSLSLDLLDALHARWCVLLEGLGPEQLERTFLHPDSGPVRLDANIGIYAWHGRHHLAHVEELARREGWIAAR